VTQNTIKFNKHCNILFLQYFLQSTIFWLIKKQYKRSLSLSWLLSFCGCAAEIKHCSHWLSDCSWIIWCVNGIIFFFFHILSTNHHHHIVIIIIIILLSSSSSSAVVGVIIIFICLIKYKTLNKRLNSGSLSNEPDDCDGMKGWW
jgi:hypothetical protein